MKRWLSREVLAAALVLVVGAALLVGSMQLRALRPSPRTAAAAATPVPWLPTDAGFDAYALVGTGQRMTPSDAATQVKKTVGGADPVLLPAAVSPSATADVIAESARFSVEYVDAAAHEWLGVSVTYPETPLTGPHAMISTRSFRGVVAKYGVDDPSDPLGYRYLMWNEPGRWDQSPDNILQTIGPTPAPITGVPYALRATGMSESRFWALANSIGSIPWPATPPACRASDLRAAFPAIGNGAGGHVLQSGLIVNHGAAACTLFGSPRLTLLTSGGTPIALAPAKGGFFPESPASPVVLQPSSIEPSEANYVNASEGQMAMVNVELYYCNSDSLDVPGPLPPVSAVRFDLPSSGGTLMAGLVRQPATSRCDTGGVERTIFVSPFVAAGATASGQWVSAPSPVSVKLLSPSAVKTGTALEYQVALTNVSGAPYHFEQCPSYREAMDTVPRKQVLGLYRLNCAPVGTIAPGASVTFAMVIDVPATAPTGPQQLTWQLDVGDPSGAQGTAAVRITA